MYSMVLTVSLSSVGGVSLYVLAQQSTHCLCLLLWTQIRGSVMVRAADCRSAGPWFNSGWRSWFTFVTGSDNLMNHPAQRYNIMSPIRTVITTLARKSVMSEKLFILTHFAFVDCVNSDSCYCDPEVTIQSCHVFFCATTVVCKRHRCLCCTG